ncbi:MAG: menaquinone biosynthetic enzyme MqnA/MqnD family protein [Bacteroidales bacterium]
MTEPLKISAISYLNTVPFVYGIKHSGILKDFSLTFDVPSTCAEKLKIGEADIGIVPVAAIPMIPDAHIVTDYCIGAVGPVKSVILVSMSTLDNIHTIYLDPDSRTSVQLVRILVSEYWKIDVQYNKLNPQLLQNLPEGTAAVIIGDKTFGMEAVFPVIYDLAGEWNTFTGLPFVFACWVSRGELPENIRNSFNQAIGYGILHLDEAISTVDPSIYPELDMHAYFRENISFPFDPAKKAGLKKFLAYLNPR